jgi:DNA-directed RNA polymerase subunit RPC12/RpoP
MLRDLSCPICDADLPLAGDERPGDELHCTVCGAPILIKGDPKSAECEVEEDF